MVILSKFWSEVCRFTARSLIVAFLGCLLVNISFHGMAGATTPDPHDFRCLSPNEKYEMIIRLPREDAVECFASMDAYVLFLKESLKTMESRLRTDPLTGLGNREALAQEKRKAENYKGSYYAITFDIDHFKHTNDTFGHDVGDVVLRRIGEILNDEVRSTDLIHEVVRSGGEEFIVLMKMTSRDDVNKAVSRFRERIKQEVFVGIVNGQEIPFQKTISIGLAERKENEDFDQLIKRSDLALYKAKEKRDHAVWAEDLTSDPCTKILR